MGENVFVPHLQVTPNKDISTGVNTSACQITTMHLTYLGGWKLPPAYQRGAERQPPVNQQDSIIPVSNTVLEGIFLLCIILPTLSIVPNVF